MLRKLKSKFTLIELLVVVAIIGILVSMLLPALAHTKQAAYRTLCLNNLKQQGTALFMYAHAFEGRLPVHKGVTDTTLGYLNRPWKLELAWNTSAPVGERGWGMLYRGSNIDPRIFYCSSQKDAKHSTPDCYYQPWGSKSSGDPRPGTDSIRTGYFYKPYDERNEDTLYTIRKIRPDHMLSIDLIETFGKAAHGEYWQHLEGDGHAESARQRVLYNYLMAGNDFNAASGWDIFRPYRESILDSQ